MWQLLKVALEQRRGCEEPAQPGVCRHAAAPGVCGAAGEGRRARN